MLRLRLIGRHICWRGPTPLEAVAGESTARTAVASGTLRESAAGIIAGEAQRLLKPDRIARLGIRIGGQNRAFDLKQMIVGNEDRKVRMPPVSIHDAKLASALAVYPSGDIYLDVTLRVRCLDRLCEGIFLIRACARQIGNGYGVETSRCLK